MDCGASRVALAAFGAQPDGSLSLEDLAVFPHPAGEAAGTPWILGVASALGSAGIARRFSGPLHIAPPSHEVLLKFLKVPQVAPAKRAKVIEFEAQQNIPYPLNEVVWSAGPVCEDAHEFEIALAAAKRELMEELCGTVRRAGWMPACIEPASLAMHRGFRHNYPDVGGPVLLVDIGARMTELVFTNAERFFARPVAVGGNAFTQALADELGQGFDEAEAAKIRILSGRAEPSEGSPVATAFEKATHALTNKLGLEITRSTVAVRRHTGWEAPAFVYLTGGGARIGSLQPLLAAKLRMQVEWFDAFRRVTATHPDAAEAHMHQLCGLIGMAVGAFDEDRAGPDGRVDLLPPRVRRTAAFRRRQPKLLAAAALAVSALALPVVHFSGEARILRAQVERFDAVLAGPRAIQARNRVNLQQIEEARAQAVAIGALVGTRSNWINFLSDLQGRLGAVGDVWIDRLQMLREAPATPPAGAGLFGEAPATAAVPAKAPLRLFVAGRLVDRRNPVSKVSLESTASVRALMASLSESPFIASVENERYDTTQPGILRFEFTMAVDPEHPL